MRSGKNTEFNSVKFVDRRTINFFFPRLVLHRVAKLSIVHLCVYRVVTTCLVSYRLENAHILFPFLPHKMCFLYLYTTKNAWNLEAFTSLGHGSMLLRNVFASMCTVFILLLKSRFMVVNKNWNSSSVRSAVYKVVK